MIRISRRRTRTSYFGPILTARLRRLSGLRLAVQSRCMTEASFFHMGFAAEMLWSTRRAFTTSKACERSLPLQIILAQSSGKSQTYAESDGPDVLEIVEAASDDVSTRMSWYTVSCGAVLSRRTYCACKLCEIARMKLESHALEVARMLNGFRPLMMVYKVSSSEVGMQRRIQRLHVCRMSA